MPRSPFLNDMLHDTESCIKTTVTIKLPPCDAEQVAKIGNEITQIASIHNYTKYHTNARSPLTLNVRQVGRRSVVAGGIVVGDVVYSAVGIFPYQGGPKGFETKNVEDIFVNETFSRERCCGIIGRANGFSMYDRFCTKKKCGVKAHQKPKFTPNTSPFLCLAETRLHSVATLHTA